MIQINFEKQTKDGLNILCLGAHSDDIEIGCGGTILKLLSQKKVSHIHWIVFSASGQRKREARVCADRFLESMKSKKVVVKQFKDGFFPYIGSQIKEAFEELKCEIDPDIIFTHYRNDLHQDHRVISELALNTYRNQLILEYEILKYDGDIGNPNLYSCLDAALCKQKINVVMDSFKSQLGHQWFDEETFRSLMRLRGIEANSPGRYAEAFYCRKAIF